VREVTSGRMARGGGAAYVGTATSGGGIPSRGGMASVMGCASTGRHSSWCVRKDGAQMRCVRKGGGASGRMTQGRWCDWEACIRVGASLAHAQPAVRQKEIPGAGTQSTRRDGLRKGAVSSKAAEATRATGGPGREGVFFPMLRI
jgi:hypothetical protein